jgi:hypothetical protein
MPSEAPADAADIRVLAVHAETAIERGGHRSRQYKHQQDDNPAEATGPGVTLLFDITGAGQFEVRITAPSPVPGPWTELGDLTAAGLITARLATAADKITDALENAGMDITGQTAQDGQPSITVDAAPHGRFAMLIGDPDPS